MRKLTRRIANVLVYLSKATAACALVVAVVALGTDRVSAPVAIGFGVFAALLVVGSVIAEARASRTTAKRDEFLEILDERLAAGEKIHAGFAQKVPDYVEWRRANEIKEWTQTTRGLIAGFDLGEAG